MWLQQTAKQYFEEDNRQNAAWAFLYLVSIYHMHDIYVTLNKRNI